MATSAPCQQAGHFVRHFGFFHWLADGKDRFKKDFLFWVMKLVMKSILELKWELTQNVETKSAFSPKINKKWRKALTIVVLWLWPKVKTFRKCLSYSIFQVHSNFGIHFFIWDSKIAQTVQFLESWLLYKSWPKVKIFKKDLSCSVFHVGFDFGVYFFIWESKSSQIVWFYGYWLWCELWPRTKMSEQSLSHSDFCEDSDFEIHLFV